MTLGLVVVNWVDDTDNDDSDSLLEIVSLQEHLSNRDCVVILVDLTFVSVGTVGRNCALNGVWDLNLGWPCKLDGTSGSDLVDRDEVELVGRGNIWLIITLNQVIDDNISWLRVLNSRSSAVVFQNEVTI